MVALAPFLLFSEAYACAYMECNRFARVPSVQDWLIHIWEYIQESLLDSSTKNMETFYANRRNTI